MENAFADLANLLQGQMDIYQELLSLGKQKQAELVKGSIDSLENLNRQEETLILKAGRLEEERFTCTTQLMTRCGLPEGTPLKELIKAAPFGFKDKLASLQKSLKELLLQMEKVNQENMELIQNSLRFIQFSVETLTQETQTTYTADRAMKVENLTKLLDKKV